MDYIPSVLVYLRRDEDEVLLMHRHKEPNLGLWVAPGGKVEPGESPQETAQREMLEETGLHVTDLQLRSFCTEVSPLEGWQWFLFIFVGRAFTGELRPDLREGALAWVSRETYFNALPIPQADKIFAPRVLDDASSFFHAKFTYDAALQLTEWVAY